MTTDRSQGTDRRVLVVAALVSSGLLAPAAGLAQDAASLPEGPGRELVTSQCVSCHPLSTAVVKRGSRAAWEETVARMITTYLAPIDDADRETIVAYLSAHYGEDAAIDPGQQLLVEQCFRCHGEGMWSDLETDRDGWVSVLYRMIGRGALWTPEQVDVMADYLTKTYPAGEGE